MSNQYNQYKQYSVNDFDIFDCLKISNYFYLVLFYILRGYIVWILSVTNMRDRIGTIQWIYPDKNIFFLSLVSGGLGLFVVLILSMRKPGAAEWVQCLWPHARTLLVIALLFDLLVNFISFLYWQLISPTWLLSQAVISMTFIVICYTNKRIKINLAEFPQKLPKS